MDANDDVPVIELVRWSGPWAPDDPDANFKAEVADYCKLDPLRTVTGLANKLRSLLSWLKYPLEDDTVYEV